MYEGVLPQLLLVPGELLDAFEDLTHAVNLVLVLSSQRACRLTTFDKFFEFFHQFSLLLQLRVDHDLLLAQAENYLLSHGIVLCVLAFLLKEFEAIEKVVENPVEF